MPFKINSTMTKNLFFLYIIVVIIPTFSACEKERQNDTLFSIKAAYDSIMSCPESGGVFIISLVDSSNTSGSITLTFDAAPELNASLTKINICKAFPVTELTIKPAKNVRIGNHEIRLHASDGLYIKTIHLFVKIVDWSNMVGEISMNKKDEFILWLQRDYPDIKVSPSTPWFAYLTYPQVLIVEHVTLLNDDYEFRICAHAMIPPHDWSMIRLRKRNEVDPFFAARQDSTGGPFYQIPVVDYPLLYGY